jgi:hypothetical protein
MNHHVKKVLIKVNTLPLSKIAISIQYLPALNIVTIV